MNVYLAGPINGCTDHEAMTWRELVKERLGSNNCIDPMRRDYRGHEDENIAEIVEGDKRDIDTADIVLANCWQFSAGTLMEIMYAYNQFLRVLAIVHPDSRVSPWLRYHAHVVHSLDEALKLIEQEVHGA